MRNMIHIYLLHGFLGLPSDWDFLDVHFEHCKLHKVHLFEQFKPDQGISSFIKEFNQLIDPEQNNILVGYSLGGRLGVQVVIDQPGLWKGASFISTHPGLKEEAERATRIINDGLLAMRFLTMKWPELMEKWNEQPVFAYSKHFARQEEDYNRAILADVLTHWGLGQQQDLRESLAKLDIPIQWIVGKNDSKFLEIGQSIKFKHSKSQFFAVEDAGHRVPWDQPQHFIDILKQFTQ